MDEGGGGGGGADEDSTGTTVVLMSTEVMPTCVIVDCTAVAVTFWVTGVGMAI